jgi:DtxR family Mn-dependent transcriptional regulator
MSSGERESRVAVQDYVKAIWSLCSDTDASVSTGSIASVLGVSSPSVSSMLRRLEADGLIEHEPYRGVQLTDRGVVLALEVVRHHRLLETFLSRTLGMPWHRVHTEAEILEHHISEELEDLIDQHLGYPEFDPHGHPIPRRDGTLPALPVRSLSDLDVSDQGEVAQVRDDSPDVLQYLERLGLVVGAYITITAVDRIAGTITIQAPDAEPCVLGLSLAQRIDLKGNA